MADMAIDASVDELNGQEIIQPASDCQQFTIPVGELTYFDEEEGKIKQISIDDWALYFLPGCNNEHTIAKLGQQSWDYQRDPFYGSVTPIAYTASATTVMSWLLLVLIFLSQQHRPLLQKAATLVIAISLTVSLADITKSLQHQYVRGYQDADELRQKVYNGLAYQILRIISGVILWLSHIQVALRLYEKPWQRISIKTVGAVLVILDLIMQCLSNYYKPVAYFNDRFHSPFYVILYVVELIILVVYALVVIIYSVRKKKYAFNHKALAVGCISIASLLLPIVFLTMGAANYWLAGWTGFASRVCSIAATVIIWGWIDVTEKIEKDQLKTGVMGRRIHKKNSTYFNDGEMKTESNDNYDDDEDGDEDDESNNNNNNNNNTGSQQPSSKMKGPSEKFPWSWFKSHWIISRGDSANSGSTSYGQPVTTDDPFPPSRTDDHDNTNHQPSALREEYDITEQSIPTTNSNYDGDNAVISNVAGENGVTRHFHPVRRSNRSNAPIPNASSDQNFDRSNNGDGDNYNGDEDYYIDSSPTGENVATTSRQPPNTPPPDAFPPLPNFNPGDYWDEKAPPPDDFAENDETINNNVNNS